MAKIKKLWRKWIEYTHEKTCRLNSRDMVIYGNAFREKCWWGWRRLDPTKVVKEEIVWK